MDKGGEMIKRQRLSWLAAVLVGLSLDPAYGQTSTPTPDPYAGLSGQQIQFFCGQCTEANQNAFRVLLDRFEAKTGAKVIQVVGQCGVTQLAGQVQAKNVTYGVYEFCSSNDRITAEQQGLLEKLDKTIVPVGVLQDGQSDDYVINITPYVEAILYDATIWPATGKHPTKATDFFDTQNFPGKRCLHRNPQTSTILELALLADGVKKSELYPLDIERALKKLNTVRSVTTVVATTGQALQALLSGQCAMYNTTQGAGGNLAKQNPDKKIAMGYGDSIVLAAEIGIPKGAPNPKVAQALFRWFLTDMEGWQQAMLKTPYVPAFKNPPPVPSEVQPWVLLGKNLEVIAGPRDEEYWVKNGEAILARFNEWLASGK
jgi:putative spermidine/putrescine transport system substrate-binding protein